MKPGAFVINTGRGALRRHRGAHRGAGERPAGRRGTRRPRGRGRHLLRRSPRQNRWTASSLLRLQEMPNVIVTPHTAYYTDHALSDTVENSIINCLDFESRTREWTKVKIGIIFGGCLRGAPRLGEVGAGGREAPRHPTSTSRSGSASRKAATGGSATGPDRLADGGRPVVLSPDRSAARPARAGRAATRRSASTSSSRSCTASSARTARCRACSSSPASRTSAATSRARRCAWTSRSPTSSRAAPASPRRTSGSRHRRVHCPTQLPYPVFVKPARSGSSFGVSKVSRPSELAGALRRRPPVRRQGPDRGGGRRQRDRLRDPRQRRRPGRRRGRPGRAVARLLPHPPGGHAGERLRELDVHRARRHPGRSRANSSRRRRRRSTAALGCRGLARVDMFLTRGRHGGAQRGQHAARPHLVQPLSADDGRGRAVARRRASTGWSRWR